MYSEDAHCEKLKIISLKQPALYSHKGSYTIKAVTRLRLCIKFTLCYATERFKLAY